MNDIVRRFAAAALVAAGFSAVLPGTATAQVMQQHEGNNLASLSLMSEKLHPSPTLEPMDGVRSNLAANLDAAWATFQLNHGAWNAHLDSRSGRIEYARWNALALFSRLHGRPTHRSHPGSGHSPVDGRGGIGCSAASPVTLDLACLTPSRQRG